MKKIIILVLVIALSLTAFAGCGSSKELDETKAKLAETQKKLEEVQKTLDTSKVYSQEPFTSASKPQPKYDLGVTLDEVSKLPSQGFPGTYLIATVNPDGTANIGYVIYGVTKVGDKFYVKQGINNQTNTNLHREKGGVAVWAAQYNSKGSIIADPAKNPTATKAFTTRGIKMTLKLTEDKAVAEALKIKEGTYAYEVVSYVPLG
ncbi:MAG: hypothetical protein RR327_02200 [Clostridia bacterium]